MAGKKSRDKGRRGEGEVRKILGSQFKRTGVAYSDEADLTSDWSVVSVKNHTIPISLHKALEEIIKLEGKAPDKNHYVAVKVGRGTYLIIERIEQFRDDRAS